MQSIRGNYQLPENEKICKTKQIRALKKKKKNQPSPHPASLSLSQTMQFVCTSEVCETPISFLIEFALLVCKRAFVCQKSVGARLVAETRVY